MQEQNYTIPYIGVILSDRQDRIDSVLRELKVQGIGTAVDFFPAIHDKRSVAAGIGRAHKQIVRIAKIANLESVVIIEDDARFCGEGAFQYFLDSTPNDYDIFLSGIYTGEIREDNSVDAFSGFHCYRVHRRYYETFLAANEEEHIDRAQAGKGRFYVCNPFACVQWNGFSFQTRKEENYDPLLAGRRFFNNYLDF